MSLPLEISWIIDTRLVAELILGDPEVLPSLVGHGAFHMTRGFGRIRMTAPVLDTGSRIVASFGHPEILGCFKSSSLFEEGVIAIALVPGLDIHNALRGHKIPAHAFKSQGLNPRTLDEYQLKRMSPSSRQDSKNATRRKRKTSTLPTGFAGHQDSSIKPMQRRNDSTLASADLATLRQGPSALSRYKLPRHLATGQEGASLLIAAKLDSEMDLDEAEITILSEQGCHLALAMHFDRKYSQLREPKSLAHACIQWQKAGNYQRCIELVDSLAPFDLQAMSAVHLQAEFSVSSGYAMAAAGRIDDAESRAQEALRLQPSAFEAHALIGLLHLLQGRIESSDSCFHRAKQLGATEREVRRVIQSAFDKMDRASRYTCAKSLCSLSADRYAWLSTYAQEERPEWHGTDRPW